MSRSDRLPSWPAFVRYPLKSLGTPASLRAGPREHSGAIGDARARSEPLGSPRSRAYPARAPHLAELWTVMLRGPLPHLGVEPASRGVIRRGRGARSTETFPLARPGAACTPLHHHPPPPARASRRSWDSKGPGPRPPLTPRLHAWAFPVPRSSADVHLTLVSSCCSAVLGSVASVSPSSAEGCNGLKRPTRFRYA